MFWRLPAKEWSGRHRLGRPRSVAPATRWKFEKRRPRRRPDRGCSPTSDGLPAGWCAVAPRPGTRGCSPPRRLAPADPDEPGVWSVTCFFVHRKHRRAGLAKRAPRTRPSDWGQRPGRHVRRGLSGRAARRPRTRRATSSPVRSASSSRPDLPRSHERNAVRRAVIAAVRPEHAHESGMSRERLRSCIATREPVAREITARARPVGATARSRRRTSRRPPDSAVPGDERASGRIGQDTRPPGRYRPA